jgi:hypothetical protein
MNASSKAITSKKNKKSKKSKSNKSKVTIKALSKIVERESSDSSDSNPSSPHRLTRAISADSKVQQFNDCFAYSIGRIVCKWIRNHNPTFFPNFDENDTRLSDAFPVYFFFEATEGSSVGEDLSVNLFIKTHNIPKSSYLNHCLFVLIYSVIVRQFGCDYSNIYDAFEYIIGVLNTKQSVHSLIKEICPIYQDYCDICIDVLLHNVNSGMELFYFKFLNNDKNTIDEYNEIKNKPIHSQIFGMATRHVYDSINQMYTNIKNVITQKKYNNYVGLLCNVVLFKAKTEYGLNTEISFSNLEDCFKRLESNNNRENHMVTIVDYNYDDPNNRQITIKNTWSILEPTMIIYEKELFNSIIINLDNTIAILGIVRATKESDWVSIEESKTNKTRRRKIKRKASSSNKKGKKNKVSKIKENESISPASPRRLTRAISADSKVQRFNDCFAYSIGRILCKWIRVHNSKFFPNFDENDTRLSDAFPVERFYESTTKTSLGENPDIISFIEENGITKSVYLNHCLFILFYSVIVREVGCDNAVIGIAFMYIIEQIKTEQSVRMLMQNCPIYKDYCDICLDVLLHNVKSGINSVVAIDPINNINTIINTIPIKVTPDSSSSSSAVASVVASDKTYVNYQIKQYITEYYDWKKDPENDNEPTYTGYSWKDIYINLFNRYVNLFFEQIKQNINIFHNYLSLICNTALFNAKRSLGQETELSLKNISDYAKMADDANPSKLNEYNHVVTIVGYNYDNPKNRQIIIKNTWSKDNPIMIIYEGELFNPIMFRNSNLVALYYIAQRDTRETDWVSVEITLKHTKTKKIKRKKIRQLIRQSKGTRKGTRKRTRKGTRKRTRNGPGKRTKKRKSSN